MRLLHRGLAPLVLSEFNFNEQNWDDHIKPKHRALIWPELYKMQGKRCAYCERTLDEDDPDDKHIEHFRQKGKDIYKYLTFAWGNLFGSCNTGDRCGRYKDKSGISPERIIKADEEDPEKYFTFISNGSIMINDNLTQIEKERASDTLTAFLLNPKRGGVKYERLRIIDSHKYLFNEFEDLVNEVSSSDDGVDYSELLKEALDEYCERIKDQPFSTAIKHVLTRCWVNQN